MFSLFFGGRIGLIQVNTGIWKFTDKIKQCGGKWSAFTSEEKVREISEERSVKEMSQVENVKSLNDVRHHRALLNWSCKLHQTVTLRNSESFWNEDTWIPVKTCLNQFSALNKKIDIRQDLYASSHRLPASWLRLVWLMVFGTKEHLRPAVLDLRGLMQMLQMLQMLRGVQGRCWHTVQFRP